MCLRRVARHQHRMCPLPQHSRFLHDATAKPVRAAVRRRIPQMHCSCSCSCSACTSLCVGLPLHTVICISGVAQACFRSCSMHARASCQVRRRSSVLLLQASARLQPLPIRLQLQLNPPRAVLSRKSPRMKCCGRQMMRPGATCLKQQLAPPPSSVDITARVLVF